MSHERYRSDLEVGLDDLATCGWQEAIKEVADADYSALWNALAVAAQKALEHQEFKRAKVLWLLAEASSMMLKPSATHQPFLVMGESRSPNIDDFTDADVMFFADASFEIGNNWLRARLADVVWTRKRAMRVTTTSGMKWIRWSKRHPLD
ncbi:MULTISPECIES: DUF7380 domain-containing protein [Paraburkholderia]|jgi:hypothetical protein|uniref:DUF7380 domain-containing protein n=1 Tax=Paraburkholderia TaxID=1822464 RepID=UPI0038BD193C